MQSSAMMKTKLGLPAFSEPNETLLKPAKAPAATIFKNSRLFIDRSFEGGAIKEIDINVAIIVIIEQSQPRCHSFHDVIFSAAAVVMLKVDPRFADNIAKRKISI